MSLDHNQYLELHGIGGSFGRGTKRTADHLNVSHPYGAIQDGQVWKREPSLISTASTRRPKPVNNPYNGLSAGGRSLMKPNGSNPMASMTVTDARLSKKRKTSGMGFDGPSENLSSKFWPTQGKHGESSSRELRAVPSTVRTSTSRSTTRTGAEVSHSGLDQRSARINRMVPLLSSPRIPSAEAISVDESGSDVEKDFGTAIPRSLSVSDNGDEIDFIDRPLNQHPSSKLPRKSYQSEKPSIAQELGIPEPNSDHPFVRRASPSLHISTVSPTQTRRIAKDGASTKRLRRHIQQETSTNGSDAASSPLSPAPPLLEDAGSDEVEEIEDADEFSNVPIVSSSKAPSAGRVKTRLSNRAPTPGASAIKRGRVKQIADEIEEKSMTNGTKFIPDLKQVGSQKSRIDGMKRANPSAITSNRGKGPTSQNGVSSRDALATAQTAYARVLTLPLEMCIWGTRKYDSGEKQLQPDYWLYWNEDASELQLHKHPLADLKTLSKKKSVQSIKLSLLKNCEVTFSDDSDFHIVRIEFENKSDKILPAYIDEILDKGLTFKFLSRHPNMSNWGALRSQMKALVAESGKGLQRVIGVGARACLQIALASINILGPKTRKKRKETIDATHSESAGSAVADKEANTLMQKKKQPRPRPANGKDQNIAEMLNEGSTRRSSRLLTKREEPPVNLDEIILVYPPSGQGAVNITNGDLRRLEPSEFLNDTLIELGLKFWLTDLRTQQPELAENIHVFSSFFFKKLASKNNKNPEAGHKSVRKWTAKVDIFKKKYIIVPINENIHWYLAIIYHPEHVLEPSLPKPPPRSSKRVSNAAANKESSPLRKGTAEEAVDRRPEGCNSRGDAAEAPASSPTTRENDSEAEAEVEKELVDDAELGVVKSLRSCSLDESQCIPHIRAESPDGDLAYPVQQTEDRLSSGSAPFDQVETHKLDHDGEFAMDDDFSMELGHIEGGGPSTKPTVVEDSLSEDSEDTEVDQLDEDDRPSTSHMANSSSTAPLPSRTDALEPSSFGSDDGASLMDVDEPPRGVTLPLPEPSIDESIGHLDEQEAQTPHEVDDEGYSASGFQSKQHQSPSPVPPKSFYAPPTQKIKTYEDRKRSPADFISGRSNRELENDELNMLVDHYEAERESSEEPEVTERPRTIIFCMDSLGSSHPKALSRLDEYLQEEAKDKKGIENPSSAFTKKALVPTQPNFCDCGLYLLHFAQTFMTDPEKYKAAILATKKSAVADREVLWLDKQVGTMRERMKTRILAESETWKKLRAEKEQKELENKGAAVEGDAGQPLQAEQSDDEIEVSEVRRVESSPKKSSKKAPSTPAARIR